MKYYYLKSDQILDVPSAVIITSSDLDNGIHLGSSLPTIAVYEDANNYAIGTTQEIVGRTGYILKSDITDRMRCDSKTVKGPDANYKLNMSASPLVNHMANVSYRLLRNGSEYSSIVYAALPFINYFKSKHFPSFYTLHDDTDIQISEDNILKSDNFKISIMFDLYVEQLDPFGNVIGRMLISGIPNSDWMNEVFGDRYRLTSNVLLYIPTIDFDAEVQLYIASNSSSDPYYPGGTSGVGGGGGNFGYDPSTGLPFPNHDVTPDIPNGSVSANIGASRMFTHYACDISDVSKVADILWSRTFHDALEQLYISAIYGKPAELVIGLMSFPFDVSAYASTVTKPLFLGDYNTGENFLSVTSNAFAIDWGSIGISEYWGNFLDYAPHTKIELYLPWSTGFISIDPNDCTPGTISVQTNIDVAKGTCVHNVVSTVTRNGETTKTIIGTYSGQCGRQIPIIGNDYVARAIKTFALGAAAIAGGILLGTATGGAMSGAAASSMTQLPAPSSSMGIGAGTAIGPFTGNIGQSVSGGSLPPLMHPPASPASPALYTPLIDEDFDYTPAMKLASSTATMMTPVTVSRNGSFVDGNSEMTIQYPYVVISRPMQSVPSGYGNHYGYPSNITKPLGELKGYTEVGSIHLNGLSATANEIRELTRILQGGFII